MRKKGIVVACSRKPPGRCVVVWSKEDQCFYRLIADHENGDGIYPASLGLQKDQYLQLGTEIEFDVITYNLRDPYQPENILINENTINILSVPSFYDAIVYADKHIFPNTRVKSKYLFNNSGVYSSLFKNSLPNDRYSFAMVKVYNLRFRRETVYGTANSPEHDKCVADFEYNFCKYTGVSVTLKDSDTDLAELADANVEYNYALVCFSLTKPYGSSEASYICLCSIYKGRKK